MLTEERGSPPKIYLNDIPKTMEGIDDYLTLFHRESGVHLGYVVSQNLIPKPTTDDPSTNYVTTDLEMIVCGPIMVTGTTGT